MLLDKSTWLVADAVEAVTRLDDAVLRAGTGFATLLMLRTGQRIAKSELSADSGQEFANLLGWWFAAESREHVAVDPEVQEAALALDEIVEKLAAGRALTMALLRESHRGVPAGVESVVVAAHAERWSGVRCATALSVTGDTLMHRVVRSAALQCGGSAATALCAVDAAADQSTALHQLARAARAVRERVARCGDAQRLAAQQCDAFGRAGINARRVVAMLDAAPATTILGASAALALSIPAVTAAITRLLDVGVVREITGRGRDRVFVYAPAVALAG